MQSKAPENVSGSLRCNKQAGISMIRGACRKRYLPWQLGAAVKVLSCGIWRGSSGRVRVRRREGRGCPDQCSSCPVYRRHTYQTPRGRRHVGPDLREWPEVFCHPYLPNSSFFFCAQLPCSSPEVGAFSLNGHLRPLSSRSRPSLTLWSNYAPHSPIDRIQHVA